VSPLTNLAFRDIAQSLAGVLALAYASGFVVVTAHLGRFGLKDYDAFRVQYLVAGAIVWVTIGLFAYFVGRRVLRIDADTEEYIKLFESVGGKGSGWATWAFFYTVGELAYFLVVCTLITGSLLFTLPSTNTLLVVIAIVAGQQLVDMVLNSAASRHLTQWSFVWVGAFFATALAGFLFVADGPYRELFVSLCLLATGLNAYQYQRSHSMNPNLVKAYFVGFGLLVISGAFGAHFYDRVRPSIGGGAPHLVRLIVDETKMPEELKNLLGVEGNTSKPVDLLAGTATEILVGEEMDHNRYKKMFRIKRELDSAMSFADPRPPNTPESGARAQ
jgi:hypothetical protein